MDNLLSAAQAAGVGHAVILSIVGADLVPDLVYYRAKVLQEDLLKAGPVPYSIVRATQFFEFMDALVAETADDKTVRLPAALIQPMASADVAQEVAEVSAGARCGAPRNSPGPTSSGSTSWARSPSPPTVTSAPSSPTAAPACSPPSPATPSSPRTAPSSPRPATGSGSRASGRPACLSRLRARAGRHLAGSVGRFSRPVQSAGSARRVSPPGQSAGSVSRPGRAPRAPAVD